MKARLTQRQKLVSPAVSKPGKAVQQNHAAAAPRSLPRAHACEDHYCCSQDASGCREAKYPVRTARRRFLCSSAGAADLVDRRSAAVPRRHPSTDPAMSVAVPCSMARRDNRLLAYSMGIFTSLWSSTPSLGAPGGKEAAAIYRSHHGLAQNPPSTCLVSPLSPESPCCDLPTAPASSHAGCKTSHQSTMAVPDLPTGSGGPM